MCNGTVPDVLYGLQLALERKTDPLILYHVPGNIQIAFSYNSPATPVLKNPC